MIRPRRPAGVLHVRPPGEFGELSPHAKDDAVNNGSAPPAGRTDIHDRQLPGAAALVRVPAETRLRIYSAHVGAK